MVGPAQGLFPVDEEDDLVASAEHKGRNGGDDCRLSSAAVGKPLGDPGFRVRVDGARRLDEDRDGRVQRECAGERRSLALASGHRSAAFGDLAVKPSLRRGEDVGAVGCVDGAQQAGIDRPLPRLLAENRANLAARLEGVGNLSRHCARLDRLGVRTEQIRAERAHVQLGYRAGVGDVFPDLGQPEATQIDAVGVHFVGVVGSGQARGEGGGLLRRARYEGDRLPRADPHPRRSVGQGRTRPVGRGEAGIGLGVGNEALGREDARHLLRPRPCPSGLVRRLDEGFNGNGQIRGEAVKGHKRSGADRAVVRHPQSLADHHRRKESRAGLGYHAQTRSVLRGADAGVAHPSGLRRVGLVVKVGASHAAHDAQSGDSVGGDRRESPRFLALLGHPRLEGLDHPAGDDHENRHPDGDEKPQRHGDADHESHNRGEAEERSDDRRQISGERTDSLGVHRHRRDDVAGGHVAADVGSPAEHNAHEPTGGIPRRPHGNDDFHHFGHACDGVEEDEADEQADAGKDLRGQPVFQPRIEHFAERPGNEGRADRGDADHRRIDEVDFPGVSERLAHDARRRCRDAVWLRGVFPHEARQAPGHGDDVYAMRMGCHCCLS